MDDDGPSGLVWLREPVNKFPDEAYRGIAPANKRPRWEPRPHWPFNSACAAPPAKLRRQPGIRLDLVVGYLDGRKHLPIIALKHAA